MIDIILRIGAALLGAAVVGLVVYKIYEAYLDKQKAKEIALEKARNETKNVISKAVVEELQKGNVNIVDIGLFSSNKKVAEVRIEAKSISSDLKKGDVLFNYS